MMVSIQNAKPGMVAYLPMRGSYDQTPEAFGRLYGWIDAHGLKPKGMPAAIYFNIASDPSGEDAVWEVQSPIAGELAEAAPDETGIGIKETPAMTVLSSVHKGPYDSVLPTYQAMWDWIEDNGYELAGPPMERYLNDPDEVGAEECLTEVIMPIDKL